MGIHFQHVDTVSIEPPPFSEADRPSDFAFAVFDTDRKKIERSGMIPYFTRADRRLA
jgi:hypothetical protein